MARTSEFSTFLHYLESIRTSLYRLTIFFCLVFACGLFFSPHILRYFLIFFRTPGVTMATTSPFQLTGLTVDLSLSLALLASIPLLLYILFSFVTPAMTPREKRMVWYVIPLGIILFLLGTMYGFGILYYSLGTLAHINESFGLTNIWDISAFISEIIITGILLGALFQFPLILTALLRLHLLSPESLKSSRRVVYFSIFIIVSLLPPTDGLSLIIMTVPLILLYELVLLMH